MAQITNPPDWLTGERLVMMNFLVEKSKDAEKPLSRAKLGEEFVEKSGTDSVTPRSMTERIQKLSKRIPELEDLSMATKARMMFAFSVPVSSQFLRELKASGTVELDDQDRIISYSEEGGRRAELRGKHIDNRKQWPRDDEFLSFLATFSETNPTPTTCNILMEAFNAATNNSHNYDSFRHRMAKIRKTLFCSKFQKNTRIRMMFVVGAPLTVRILEELRIHADVDVDKNMRITRYKANNSSLVLQAKLTRGGYLQKKSPKSSVSTGDEDDDSDDNLIPSPNMATPTRSNLLRKLGIIPRSTQASKRKCTPFVRSQSSSTIQNSAKKSNYSSGAPVDVVISNRPITRHVAFASSPSQSSSLDGEDFGTPKGILKQNNIKPEVCKPPAFIKQEPVGYYDGPGPAPSPSANYDEHDYAMILVDVERERRVEERRLAQEVGGIEREKRAPATTQQTVQMVELADSEGLAKDCLLMLRSIVRTLDSMVLAEVSGQIETALEQIGQKKILLADLLTVLQTGLLIFKKTTAPDVVPDDSTSLKELLIVLRSSLFIHKTTIFDNFQMELKGTIQGLQIRDKCLPVQSIRPILETILLLLTADN